MPETHATTAESPVLCEVVRRLVDSYHPERIYLFGSAARGDVGPDSDYDLLLVIPDKTALRREDLGYRALRGTGTAVDFLAWTRRDTDRQLRLKASLPATVLGHSGAAGPFGAVQHVRRESSIPWCAFGAHHRGSAGSARSRARDDRS